MLTIHTISVFPRMFDALSQGIPARAVANKALSMQHISIRDHANDPHQTIDDRAYGGGPGMVMKVEPIRAAITASKQQLGTNTPVFHLSPQGKPITQKDLQQLSEMGQFILVASRYEGVDDRLSQDFDAELSIGDYVVSGGELPAMIIIDAVARLLPGVLGNSESSTSESFNMARLDYPNYTRPEVIGEQRVPEVLINGNHQAIAEWRQQQAIGRTWQRRPDLITQHPLSETEQHQLQQFIQSTKGKQHEQYH